MVYDWSFGEPNACPTSDHKKKLHRGNKQSRRTKTETVRGFRGKPTEVTTFIDHVVWAHCGAEDDVEWLPA